MIGRRVCHLRLGRPRCGESVSLSHLGFLIGVPGEGNGIVGDLLDVADGIEALLVIGCNTQTRDSATERFQLGCS